MKNVFKLLADLQRKPQFISADVTKVQHLSPEEKNTLQRIGISMSQLRASMTLETQVNYDRARFYQEVTRAMENALVGASLELYGEYACLTGDTKIPLLDGRTLIIKDMLEEYNKGKELWIYSCTNEGKPKAEKVLNVVKQSHTPKTFRIWLDNGKYVEASDNHRFVKRDGTLCRTDKLKVNDSLMPFHRFVPKDGYERVWNIVKKNWDSTYKMVAESVNDINLEECNKYRSKELVPSYNHKVIKIECIGEQEVYDISVSGSELFGLDCGIYIHNTNYNHLHNASVWITSESSTYQRQLTDLLDRIGVEEKIFDWAWSTGGFGDLFVKINGAPGLGIVSIEDDDHPLNMSRIDHEGILIGFYNTPQGQSVEEEIKPPWSHVHFRLLGAKRKRPLFCLAGNTKIYLLDGSIPTIKEMAENSKNYIGKSILSINPKTKEIEYDKIIDVKKTRLNAQLVRVHLDNGKYVDCTPDHPFMLRDGTYKEAQYLQPNESLMPYYTKECLDRRMLGYGLVYNPAKNGYNYIHRIPFNPKQRKGYVIHHKDFNCKNNDIDNLELITTKDHAALHNKCTKQLTKYVLENWQKPEYRKMMLEVLEIARHKPRKKMSPHKKGCNCISCRSARGEWNYDYLRIVKCFRTKFCKCGCGGQFREDSRYPKQYIHGHRPWNRGLTKETDERVAENAKSTSDYYKNKKLDLLNHKVVKIEWLSEREDTYDLTTDKNHNFPVEAGVFVHNSDPLYAEFRTIHLMTGTDTKSVTSKYGTSLLVNALPIWKRLRMAEDSLLLARLTRGIIRYIWKMRVSGGNAEAVAALMDEFSTLLKRARAVDNRSNSPYYDDKEQPMSSLEDIFIPVWGDSTNDLTYDKIGGEADIRWIVDITDLRDQLAKALRTPLVLLGGGSGDVGGFGDHSQAIEKLDIRFARSARRLQRSLKEGIKRMCQIHLAWQNMDPDPNLFDVNMSETSTAEEDELATSLDKNVDVCMKMLDMLKAVDPEADQRKALDYLNMKILKLEDFKSDEFLSKVNTATENKEKIIDSIKNAKRKPVYNMDVMGALPFNRDVLKSTVKRAKILEQSMEKWDSNFGNVKVRDDKGIQQINELKQMNFKF